MASLHGAQLDSDKSTNFSGADLTGAILFNADLTVAKLSDAVGLAASALAGSILIDAELPEAVKKFDGLDRVTEISKNASVAFIGMLAACGYSWLTIATTSDPRLITNSSSSPLPVAGTDIPIVGFYWVAPLVVLGAYLYLHLYLQRLWQALSKLPAVFPDGLALDEKAYPWLLTGLVRAHMVRLGGV
jgi:pentapeptide repeat protein